MSQPPITDPAEIAKLPDGVYRAVNGAELYHFKGQFNYLDDLCNSWVYAKEIAEAGGIACRLVPEQDWPPVMQDMIEEVKTQQAQRDELAELLRAVYCRDCDNSGQIQPDGGPCQWCDAREAALAKLEDTDA